MGVLGAIRYLSEGSLVHLGLSMLCAVMHYMLSQHCAIGLQTDCMVVLPAPVLRLLDSRVYALWP